MPRALAIIQARMTSSRLPGKVLMDLAGKPALQRMIERVRPARLLDGIVVATTSLVSDDPVAELCANLDVPCFRGDEQDVLGRYAGAARAFDADPVLRLTADCPMHDPGVIDAAIALFRNSGCDYASNAVKRTFPDGLDVEVMSLAALERSDREARHPLLREHVTLYIRGTRPDYGAGDFSRADLLNDTDLSALRWTLDTADDLARIRRFFAVLPEGFSWRDALARNAELH
ncbi:glycosyltransferase family protein [Ferrovibrio sp.]|uniref:glycosyltransferase family protein n=1 Tax=Ferrovibrio sp. TaxID=1917215 RepID=UPI0025BE7A06|nr:glycosyltransferase family protein [Ferrovibrio sp.]